MVVLLVVGRGKFPGLAEVVTFVGGGVPHRDSERSFAVFREGTPKHHEADSLVTRVEVIALYVGVNKIKESPFINTSHIFHPTHTVPE